MPSISSCQAASARMRAITSPPRGISSAPWSFRFRTSSAEPTGSPQAFPCFFAAAGFAVFYPVAEGEFLSILTFSVMSQCLGIWTLATRAPSSSSAAGVSVRTLGLDAVAISMRLSSALCLCLCQCLWLFVSHVVI